MRPPASAPASPAPAATITLAFGGDVHFTGRTLALLDDPQTAFGPVAEQLRAADFAMINLESAITERGTAQPKTFHFRAPATAYDAIKAAGIDMVSIANNHTLDYGQVGLLDTIESAAAAGVPAVGAGRNTAEAYEPYVVNVKGVRIAVVALSQVYELAEQWKPSDTRPGIAMAHNKELSVQAVKKARTMGDLVLVFLHWGTERSDCANSDQKTIAKLLADNGADIVLGAHAHVPQGDGFIGQTYVHYGLGNFIWYISRPTTISGLLTVTVQGGKVTDRSFAPAKFNNKGQPVPVAGAELAAFQERLEQANDCGGLSPNPA